MKKTYIKPSAEVNTFEAAQCFAQSPDNGLGTEDILPGVPGIW